MLYDGRDERGGLWLAVGKVETKVKIQSPEPH